MNDRHGNGRGRRPQGSKLDKVRAPYNFVPLSEEVVQVPWAEQVQQDCPFEDGVCGRLELRLLPQGPLFVRGPDDEFFHTPDGTLAIPGSSIRGMLRSVLEISTFSRMERVNDHTYGVRDLHNRELYGRHMADIAQAPNGSKQPMPLVSAGWLRCNDGHDQQEFPAHITPCSFAKIHYKLLLELARTRGVRTAQNPKENGYYPGRKQSSPDKYKAWHGASREVQVQVETLLLSNPPRRSPRLGSFGRVIGLNGNTKGTLVFTGQPNEWSAVGKPKDKRSGGGNPKQHDFVFHSPMPDRLPVTTEVFRAFEFVHSRTGEQHRIAVAPNVEWGYWKEHAFDQGGDVPVFFLLDDRGGVRALGLAMMFRLAYDHSTLDAVRNVQGKPVEGEVDMAKAIFGHVPLERGPARGLHGGLKGRVSIGLGRLEGGWKVGAGLTGVFGAPKASYYPSYIEQGEEPGELPATDPKGRPCYRTYMDRNVRPRGWKRYLQQSGISSPEPPARADGSRSENEKVTTTIKPIEMIGGAHFKVPVRVHNLRRKELGALLWALDFGGLPGARHGLGMAKSLGYGSVKLEIDRHDLITVDGEPLTDDDLDAARKAFASFMEEQLAAQPGGWAGSRQLHELLAMACPAEDDIDLRHMRIHDPDVRNEFTQAKKDGLALRPRGAGTWRGPRRVGKVAVHGPDEPEGWVRAPVTFSPGSGELSTTVGGASATATRDEAKILIGSLAPDEVHHLKKKKVRTYEVRLDTIGRRRRIAAMRIPS